MLSFTTKQYDELCEELVTNLAVDFFEDGEIDHILNEIDSYGPFLRQQVLALALALSHASSSLVPGMLRHMRAASRVLSPDDLRQWLAQAFDLRDGAGIDQALAFLSKVDAAGLHAFQAQVGLPVREAAPLLETYLRALSGRELRIVPDADVYTDTVNIYLPAIMARCPDREDNLALFKLAAATAWAQIALGTLTPDIDAGLVRSRFPSVPQGETGLDGFFGLFPDRQLALDLYTVIESFRTEYFLMRELPGLMKQAAGIKQALYLDRQRLSALSERSAFVEGLWHCYLVGKSRGAMGRRITAALASLFSVQYENSTRESVRLLFELYDIAAHLSGPYVPRAVPVFIARIRPDKVDERMQALRQARLDRLEAAITRIMNMPDLVLPPMPDGGQRRALPGVKPAQEYLLIRGRLIELDEDLRSLVREKGGIPGGVLVQGNEMGGESAVTLLDLAREQEEETPAEGALLLDEWDFRRGGYRKAWCSLVEHEGPAGSNPFVELTLKRYAGSVSLIRKKFELLKRERSIKRRQTDGDEVDLDALVESYSDLHAGISPSENLFQRTERQERNIAVLFLVDMSGSTQGWVNEAEKESLVLMSEALETLGDRYAVYGFSSMTRNQCSLFRIKGFDEVYGGAVKRRISGIRPRDYTRMGAFIRRAAALLAPVEARTKLLITLSDSRPEDGDGYKGEYAIEDTRKALIEAQGRDIHPFCITIDREAQSYLPHLFGAVNYIFIDDVRKLPDRITEIYCRLTA